MLEPAALAFLIAAPLLYGLNIALIKRASQDIPPFAAISIAMAVVVVLSLICVMCWEKDSSWDIRQSPGGFAAIVLVGFVETAAFWCVFSAFNYVSVWQYQMFGLLTPLAAALFSYWINSEPITWRLFAGLGIVGLGLFIASR